MSIIYLEAGFDVVDFGHISPKSELRPSTIANLCQLPQDRH